MRVNYLLCFRVSLMNLLCYKYSFAKIVIISYIYIIGSSFFINSSLKFEIMAKQLYVASQRVL